MAMKETEQEENKESEKSHSPDEKRSFIEDKEPRNDIILNILIEFSRRKENDLLYFHRNELVKALNNFVRAITPEVLNYVAFNTIIIDQKLVYTPNKYQDYIKCRDLDKERMCLNLFGNGHSRANFDVGFNAIKDAAENVKNSKQILIVLTSISETKLNKKNMMKYLNSIREAQPELQMFFIDFSPTDQSKKLQEFESLAGPTTYALPIHSRVMSFKIEQEVQKIEDYLMKIEKYLSNEQVKAVIESEIETFNRNLDQEAVLNEKDFRKRQEESKKVNGITFEEKMIRTYEQELKKIEIARSSAQARLDHFLNQEKELTSDLSLQEVTLSEVNAQLKDYESQLSECTIVQFSEQEQEEINEYVKRVEAYLEVVSNEKVEVESGLKILKRLAEILQLNESATIKEKIDLLQRFLKVEN